MRNSGMWLALAVALCAIPAPAQETGLPVARALRIDREPVIDGRLDEAFWADAPVQRSFIGIGKRQTPPQETEFRVVVTDRALIVGITCHEKEMNRLTANARERDGAVWSDDSVELFLAPGNGWYYQVAINTAGVIYDGRRPARPGLAAREINEGLLWAGAWDTGVFVGPDKWTVEIRAPFALLDANRGFAADWRVNVGRTEPRFGFSCWAPVNTGFHDIERFGLLQGVSADTSLYVFDNSSLKFPGFRVGRNSLRLAVPAPVESGLFDVRASSGKWMPGVRPKREVRQQRARIVNGALEVALDVPVAQPLVMNELVIEISDSATGLPVMLAAHLIRAPKPLESSAPWTVYFSSDKAVGIESKVEVAAESMPGMIQVAVFRAGVEKPVFSKGFEVSQPGKTITRIPIESLGQDGVYEVVLSARFAGIEDATSQISFYKHSASAF